MNACFPFYNHRPSRRSPPPTPLHTPLRSATFSTTGLADLPYYCNKRHARTLTQVFYSETTSVCCASSAEAVNSKYRRTMEDAYRVVDGYDGNPDHGFFAVYDGHGGRDMALYLETELEKQIAAEIKAKPDGSVEECLASAFLLTDMESHKEGLEKSGSGSTAVVCLLRTGEAGRVAEEEGKKYLYAANCGDARAVLCNGGTALRASYDHKAGDPLEIARIEEAGGFVSNKHGSHRVLGFLAVARSFGDHALKKFVPATPFTAQYELTEESEFVIIACDGVWDVLEDQEAVELVREHVAGWVGTPAAAAEGKEEKTADPRAMAADMLVEAALDKGSRDNITCICVFLSKS